MTESEIGTATKWLPEDADQIGVLEEQSAQLLREFVKLQIQCSEITVDVDDLPEIVEAVAPSLQAPQIGDCRGELSAPPLRHALLCSPTSRGAPTTNLLSHSTLPP